MDIKKLDRTALKSFFVKNAVPTESNFADLVDGTINQKEDGIAKLAGEPLALLVQVGKHWCRPREARCSKCPLGGFLPLGVAGAGLSRPRPGAADGRRKAAPTEGRP